MHATWREPGRLQHDDRAASRPAALQWTLVTPGLAFRARGHTGACHRGDGRHEAADSCRPLPERGRGRGRCLRVGAALPHSCCACERSSAGGEGRHSESHACARARLRRAAGASGTTGSRPRGSAEAKAYVGGEDRRLGVAGQVGTALRVVRASVNTRDFGSSGPAEAEARLGGTHAGKAHLSPTSLHAAAVPLSPLTLRLSPT